jgi:hypothetical protein
MLIVGLEDCSCSSPVAKLPLVPRLYPMAANYDRSVISDITQYANKADLEALLQQKFPPTAARPQPWTYITASSFLFDSCVGISEHM